MWEFFWEEITERIMSTDIKTEGRHRLQANEKHAWRTGVDAEGNQYFVSKCERGTLSLRFNTDGRLQKAEHLTYPPTLEKETSISVCQFELPEFGVALRDLPFEFQDFVDSPWAYDEEERSRLAVQVNQWRERKNFVVIMKDGVIYKNTL